MMIQNTVFDISSIWEMERPLKLILNKEGS